MPNGITSALSSYSSVIGSCDFYGATAIVKARSFGSFGSFSLRRNEGSSGSKSVVLCNLSTCGGYIFGFVLSSSSRLILTLSFALLLFGDFVGDDSACCGVLIELVNYLSGNLLMGSGNCSSFYKSASSRDFAFSNSALS